MLALSQIFAFGFKFVWPLVWAIAFFHKTDVKNENTNVALKFACLVTVAWVVFCVVGRFVCLRLAFI